MSVRCNEIKSGSIKDVMSKNIHNVGITGMRGARGHYLYHRWFSMISRCYNRKDPQYNLYGGKGVTVSNDWLYFPNYIKDIENKPNADKLKGDDSRNWHIDKDILSGDSKIYSNETTQILPALENVNESRPRARISIVSKRKKIYQLDKELNIINIFNDIMEIVEYFKNKKNKKIYRENIERCCKGKTKTSYGYIWRYKEDI